MKKSIIRFGLAGLLAGFATLGMARAEDVVEYPIHHPERLAWSFKGPLGKYDEGQLQRGFKVFKEVCSSCHSAKLLKFRNLADEGGPHFTEAQVKALAATYKVTDGPNASGDMFERPAVPSDAWPSPFPNDEAAKASNGGALPPDMSLLAKARAVHTGFPGFVWELLWPYQEQGPDYIYGVLTGYQDTAPEGVTIPDGKYYNVGFQAGAAIGMPKPLSDGQVEYTDGTPATLDNYARDVSAYLMWVAEPKLVERKQMGFRVILFLGVLVVLLGLVKRRVWSNIEH